MKTSSQLLLISICLFLAASGLAQTPVAAAITSNSSTATSPTAPPTNNSQPVVATGSNNSQAATPTTPPANNSQSATTSNNSQPVTTNSSHATTPTTPSKNNSTTAANNNSSQPVTSQNVNETITVNSSQAGTTVVITTPSHAANATVTPTNTSITLQELDAFELAGANIKNYPTQGYTLYLASILFLSGNLHTQYIAHHYCHFVSEDLMQCALFNDSTPNAKFIGTEYFITKALLNTLPLNERKLWSSNAYEVTSGIFVAPDLSSEDEFTVMEWLLGSYSKAVDTWAFSGNIPTGPPQASMALALTTQVDWNLANLMDKALNLTTTHQERRQQREELIAPPKPLGVDDYLRTGNASQYQVYQVNMTNHTRSFP